MSRWICGGTNEGQMSEDQNRPATIGDVSASEQRLTAAAKATEDRLTAAAKTMEDRLTTAAKATEDRLVEAMRGMQTELLRGFEAFSQVQTIRLRKVEIDQSNLDTALSGRIQVLENRLLQIELKLGGVH